MISRVICNYLFSFILDLNYTSYLYKIIEDTYTIESAYWPVLDRRTRKVPSDRPFRIASASEREPFKYSHVFSSEWTAKSTSSLFCFISFFFNHLQCSNELDQFFNVKIKGNFWHADRIKEYVLRMAILLPHKYSNLWLQLVHFSLKGPIVGDLLFQTLIQLFFAIF